MLTKQQQQHKQQQPATLKRTLLFHINKQNDSINKRNAVQNHLKGDIDNIQKIYYEFHKPYFHFGISNSNCRRNCVSFVLALSLSGFITSFESDLLAFFTHWNVIMMLLWIEILFNISLKLQYLIPVFFFLLSLSLCRSIQKHTNTQTHK